MNINLLYYAFTTSCVVCTTTVGSYYGITNYLVTPAEDDVPYDSDQKELKSEESIPSLNQSNLNTSETSLKAEITEREKYIVAVKEAIAGTTEYIGKLKDALTTWEPQEVTLKAESDKQIEELKKESEPANKVKEKITPIYNKKQLLVAKDQYTKAIEKITTELDSLIKNKEKDAADLKVFEESEKKYSELHSKAETTFNELTKEHSAATKPFYKFALSLKLNAIGLTKKYLHWQLQKAKQEAAYQKQWVDNFETIKADWEAKKTEWPKTLQLVEDEIKKITNSLTGTEQFGTIETLDKELEPLLTELKPHQDKLNPKIAKANETYTRLVQIQDHIARLKEELESQTDYLENRKELLAAIEEEIKNIQIQINQLKEIADVAG